MATSTTETIEVVIGRIYDQSAFFLDAWRRLERPEPPLVAEIGARCAAEIVEIDARNIGVYLLSKDNHALDVELSAVVRAVSELRSRATAPLMQEDDLSLLPDILKRQIFPPQQSAFAPPPVALSLPLSLRVARDVLRTDMFGKEALVLCELWEDYVRALVRSDGVVTSGEEELVAEISDFLKIMVKQE